MASLKRFQEDTREVAEGFECGILLDGFNDIKEGDMLEAYETREVAREESSPASASCFAELHFPENRSLKEKRAPLAFAARRRSAPLHGLPVQRGGLETLAARRGARRRWPHRRSPRRSERLDDIDRYHRTASEFEVSRTLVKSVDPLHALWHADY